MKARGGLFCNQELLLDRTAERYHPASRCKNLISLHGFCVLVFVVEVVVEAVVDAAPVALLVVYSLPFHPKGKGVLFVLLC